VLTSILALINLYGYKAIFILITIENIFPPIPCEVILTFGGFLTTISTLQPHAVIIVATLGSYLGAVILYFMGYLIKTDRLKEILVYCHFKENDFDRSVKWFDKYSSLAVLLGRLVPIIRSIISIPAGITKMNFFNFSIYTLFGSIIWNTILVFLGILLGNNWILISKYLKQYALIIGIIFLIIIMIKKRKRL
jgi:alkaline phosphatase